MLQDAKENQKKKKKLTPAERAEQARLEEERIAKIEKDLADFAGVPESAEHFDRVLTADPNNSTVWSQYAAFHLSVSYSNYIYIFFKSLIASEVIK